MVGTVGHMQPPEFTAGEAQARVHGGTRKGPEVRVDPLQPQLLCVSLTDTVGVAAQSC